MPSDDSQLDALEHTVDVAAVQNSLAHMSMPHGGIKNSRRTQANSPGGRPDNIHLHQALELPNSFMDSRSVHLQQQWFLGSVGAFQQWLCGFVR